MRGPRGSRSLWPELKKALRADAEYLNVAGLDLGGLPRGPLVCASLAVAAETIVRRLQAKEDDEGGTPNGDEPARFAEARP